MVWPKIRGEIEIPGHGSYGGSDMQDGSQQIVVGRISGIYGVQGWLKVMSYTRPRDNILTYSPWLVKLDENWQEMVLLDGRVQGKGLVAKIEGVVDRDEARGLLDADIAIERSQLTAVAPGEYYWHDIIGLDVINQQDKILGKLTELLETGANDVLVVEGKERILIPFVRDIYVLDINLEKNVIKVDWDSSPV